MQTHALCLGLARHTTSHITVGDRIDRGVPPTAAPQLAQVIGRCRSLITATLDLRYIAPEALRVVLGGVLRAPALETVVVSNGLGTSHARVIAGFLACVEDERPRRVELRPTTVSDRVLGLLAEGLERGRLRYLDLRPAPSALGLHTAGPLREFRARVHVALERHRAAYNRALCDTPPPSPRPKRVVRPAAHPPTPRPRSARPAAPAAPPGRPSVRPAQPRPQPRPHQHHNREDHPAHARAHVDHPDPVVEIRVPRGTHHDPTSPVRVPPLRSPLAPVAENAPPPKPELPAPPKAAAPRHRPAHVEAHLRRLVYSPPTLASAVPTTPSFSDRPSPSTPPTPRSPARDDDEGSPAPAPPVRPAPSPSPRTVSAKQASPSLERSPSRVAFVASAGAAVAFARAVRQSVAETQQAVHDATQRYACVAAECDAEVRGVTSRLEERLREFIPHTAAQG